MSKKLDREGKLEVIDIICQIPNIGDAQTRNHLLRDLPKGLRGMIQFSPVLRTHVINIVETVNEWESSSDQKPPIVLLIENAVNLAPGGQIGRRLGIKLTELEEDEAPAGVKPIKPEEDEAPAGVKP